MRKNVKKQTNKKELSVLSYIKFEESLQELKCLTPIFIQCLPNPIKLNRFLTRQRNIFWDLSNSSYFETDLCSDKYKIRKDKNDYSKDHFIQRSKAGYYIFIEVVNNPNMSTEEFIRLVEKYCSTIRLTRAEHNMVSGYCRKNKDCFTYEAYAVCGVKVRGLATYLKKNNIKKMKKFGTQKSILS